MKKTLFLITTVLTVGLTACQDKEDETDRTYGTGKTDPDYTMTAPDTGTAVITDTTSAANAGKQGAPPASDNLRKRDINGRPYPTDTAGGRKPE